MDNPRSSGAACGTNSDSETMEDMSSYSGDLVDIHGRAVVYLKADDGEVYVNLRDVENAGIRLFKKNYKENTMISESDILKDIECRLLHYGTECLVESNKVSRENIIDMFERIKDKVFEEKSKPQTGSTQNTPPSSDNSFRKTSVDMTENTFDEVDRSKQESPNTQISNVSGTDNIGQVRSVILGKGSFQIKVTHLLKNEPIFDSQSLGSTPNSSKLEIDRDVEEDVIKQFKNKETTYLDDINRIPGSHEKVDTPLVENQSLTDVMPAPEPAAKCFMQIPKYTAEIVPGEMISIVSHNDVVTEAMQIIPAPPMRFTTNSTPDVSKTEIDRDIEVENEETTYLVDNYQNLGSDAEVDRPLVENQLLEGVNSAPKPAAKCFMQIPESTAEIVPGEMIFIVSHDDDKLIVKNREIAEFTKKISSLVASLQKEPVTDPKVGQYVLCNRVDFEDEFFRGIIKEIHGELALLKLIDCFGDEAVPLTSLKNLDEALASLPPAQIEINYPPLKKVTEEGFTLLSELIETKFKIKSTEFNGLLDFIVDGELLSKKITLKLEPPETDAIPSPSQREPTLTKNVEAVGAESVVTEAMQIIPAPAMRFTTNSTPDVSKMEIDRNIEVVVNKQVENKETTYLVDDNQNLGSDAEVDTHLVENQPLEGVNSAPKPAAKCFMQIPKSTAEIVPGENISIVDYTDDKLIVKNRAMAGFTEKISSLVAWMQKEPLTDPRVGQYVLCNRVDFEDGFFRAIIKEIHGELALLKLIDFSGEETLPITSLKNIEEILAYLPPAHIEINYPPLKKVTDEGLTLLSELINGELEIESTNVNGLIDFRVHGELLSKKITLKHRPPKSDAIPSPRHREPTVTKHVEPVSAKSEDQNKEFEKIFFRDMPFREPEAGLNSYICFSYHGGSLTIIALSDENVKVIDKVTVNKPGDNEPYKPVQLEMCLVKYDDGLWYRGMATSDVDEKVEVKFVDYGSIAKVDVEDVRKLPEEMKTIPILGINAQIEDIEISDAVEKRLNEAIHDNEVLEVDVKVDGSVRNDRYYFVEIPSIYNLLKNEGLII